MHKEINRLKELLQPIKQLAEAATVQEENAKLRAQVAALEAAAAAAASDSGAESEELYQSQELQAALAAADKQAGEVATPPPVADKSTAADDLHDNELNDQLAEQVKISGGHTRQREPEAESPNKTQPQKPKVQLVVPSPTKLNFNKKDEDVKKDDMEVE